MSVLVRAPREGRTGYDTTLAWCYGGELAFVPTTTSWRPPMGRIVDGVLGSQDVDICG